MQGSSLVFPQVALQLILVHKCLRTKVAPEPFLSRVAHHVAPKCRLLNEGVRADAALVLLLASMGAPVVLDMLLAPERLAAHVALKGALVCVCSLVYGDPGLPPVHVRAVPAHVHRQSGMVRCCRGRGSNVDGLTHSSAQRLCHHATIDEPLCVQ